MTDQTDTQPTTRTLVCQGCGTTLSCELSGDCWCMTETARLPLPAVDTAVDCLCRDCLRKKAAAYTS